MLIGKGTGQRPSQMKTEVKTVDELTRELSVEIDPQEFAAQIEQKLVEVRRHASLKGFRPGHAPMEMIRSVYGQQVTTDVIDELIKQTYPKVVQEEKLEVASPPALTDVRMTESGGLSYTARVEVLPHIAAVNISGLSVQTVPTDPSDQDVDAAVAELRVRVADIRPVTRAAGATDIVTVDLHKKYDPKLILTTDLIADADIDLGSAVTITAFREQLVGLTAGSEKEVLVSYPADYSDPKFAGAEITYRAVVKAVKERILPDLDDTFAKGSGIADTLLGLRLKVRQDLKAQRDEMLRRMQKRQLIAQVIEKNQVAVPNGLLSEYLESAVRDLREKQGEIDEEAVRKEYHQIGLNTIRWDLLWPKLAEQEKIEVSSGDVENWIQGFAAHYGITPEQAGEQLAKSGRGSRLKESILEEKTLAHLLASAAVVPAAGA